MTGQVLFDRLGVIDTAALKCRGGRTLRCVTRFSRSSTLRQAAAVTFLSFFFSFSTLENASQLIKP